MLYLSGIAKLCGYLFEGQTFYEVKLIVQVWQYARRKDIEYIRHILQGGAVRYILLEEDKKYIGSNATGMCHQLRHG